MLRRPLLLLMPLVCGAGCAGIAPPGYIHPGPAWLQQERAQRFDPYPMTDVAPETNARPLAYIRPAPENERNQNVDSFVERFKQAPPPGLYKPSRTPAMRPGVPFVPAPPDLQTAPVFVP